jgi:hypothetical protein
LTGENRDHITGLLIKMRMVTTKHGAV